MNDKTELYKAIIEEGAIDEIKEFHSKHFHEIKHTESFGLLISRLENTERRLSKLYSRVIILLIEAKLETPRIKVGLTKKELSKFKAVPADKFL